VILRNLFLTEVRRNRFRGDYDEAVAERIMVTPAGQEAPIHLADMHRALMTLPPERREALLLVGAGGFSYEEAAAISGCAVGTMKSRVARARNTLSRMVDGEGMVARTGKEPASAQTAILQDLQRASQSGR
jgi:DNA-directed RNA polymerase specialized sigma24 family protein